MSERPMIEPPLPHLTRGRIGWGIKKEGLIINIAALLLGSFLLFLGVAIIYGFATIRRPIVELVRYNVPLLVLDAVLLITGVYFFSGSVQGLVGWFKQRKENAG